MINDYLGIAAIVVLHAYRFSPAGKYCAGDFLATSDSQPGYLVNRGKYLVGLVIYVWVALFTYYCIMGCLITAERRKEKALAKPKRMQIKSS